MDAGAILLVLFLLCLGALYILKSYRDMLDSGVNPPWVSFFGRRLSFRLCEFLVYRAMSVPSLAEVHVQAMDEQVAEKAKELQHQFPEDGAARGGVVLVGCDTFTYWRNLQTDLVGALDVRVINAAFGGSLTPIVCKHLEPLVVRHTPAVVVYACGENDLLGYYKAEDIIKNIQETHAVLRSQLPHARIVFLNPIMTPLLRTLKLDITAQSIKKSIQESVVDRDEGRSTIVEFDALETAPPEEMFLGDIHHLSREGHAKLALKLLPVIRENLAATQLKDAGR